MARNQIADLLNAHDTGLLTPGSDGVSGDEPRNKPLVSGIIVFLNAEQFIREAIESVFAQTYDEWELLLVDDGSTDASSEIAKEYARRYPRGVRYLEHDGHQNRGISASRNLGIGNARGEFIAFLDADDAWFPDKLEKQVGIMMQHPDVGLVANSAIYWYENGRRKLQPITLPHGRLSQGAWIPKMLESDDNTACPSAVLIRKDLLVELGGAEESFRGLYEDQVIWTKVTLNAPVYFDREPLILYRMHSDSYCATVPVNKQVEEQIRFYTWILKSLNGNGHRSQTKLLRVMVRCKLYDVFLKCRKTLQNEAENHIDFSHSSKNSIGYCFSGLLLLGGLSQETASYLSQDAFTFSNIVHNKGLIRAAKVLPRYLLNAVRRVVPESMKGVARPLINQIRRSKARTQLAVGIQPCSQGWGFDRGQPIHRYYLEQFLKEFSGDIHGHCLEFQENTYTTSLGGSAVAKLDILHIDHSNPLATIVADLTKPNSIPTNYFDCIICTHVLHLIFELAPTLSELHRILKPGGVLLVAVPHISMYSPQQHEFWRFTSEGLHRLLASTFGVENVIVRAYGNSLTAAGEIRGLVVHEFTANELASHDPRFAVEVCGRAHKALQN